MPRDVLLVEDNGLIALNTEDMLREIGVVTVRVAGTVALALAAIEQGLPNFALLDVYLGGESAVEIADRLVKERVPFAFASGIGEAADLTAQFAGVRILRKPYSIDMLRAALWNCEGAP
jgi:CheY-like chemotaxis protein